MDATSLLSGLKDKVLDAKNYELLKHTYNLQNDNIEQLKTSNALLSENVTRLQGQVDGLKAENESLKQNVAKLTQQVSQFNESSVSSGLSDVERAILELYRERGDEPLRMRSQIIPALTDRFARIRIESAIDDLDEAKMIEWSPWERCTESWIDARNDIGRSRNRSVLSGHYDQPVNDKICSITPKGKKYIVDNM